MDLPTAPKNFYTPSLTTLKTVLEQSNGLTTGQMTLITGHPPDIEDAWSYVGSGNASDVNNVTGSLVVGVAPLAGLSDPLVGSEEVINEYGYKVTVNAVEGIKIFIDGSGISTALIVGVALIAGRNLFSDGTNDDVRYLNGIKPLTVTDGGVMDVDEFNILIDYATPVVED